MLLVGDDAICPTISKYAVLRHWWKLDGAQHILAFTVIQLKCAIIVCLGLTIIDKVLVLVPT